MMEPILDEAPGGALPPDDDRTVTVRSRRFAAQLDWHRSSAPGAERRDAGLHTETNPEANLHALWPGRRLWAASHSGTGHRAGMPAAAPQVLAHLPADANLLALWPMADPDAGRHWLLCVIDGVILPDGDRLIDDPDEARAAILHWTGTLRASGKEWTRLVLPAGWAEPHIDPAPEEWSLEEALSGRPAIRLRAASGGSRLVRTLLGLAILAGIGWGGWFAWQDRTAPAPPAPIQAATPPVTPPPPWAALPDPGQALAQCAESLSSLARIIGGWRLTGLSCEITADGGTAPQAVWDRGVGTVRGFQHQARLLLPPEATALFTETADRVTAVLPPRSVPTVASEPGWTRADIALALADMAQRGGMSLQVNRQAPSADSDPNPALPSPPAYDAVTVTGRLTPADWSPILATIPGLRLDLLRWNPSTRLWTVSGTIYEKPQP